MFFEFACNKSLFVVCTVMSIPGSGDKNVQSVSTVGTSELVNTNQ